MGGEQENGRYKSARLPRACIIGAGSSGIALASNRHTIQADFDDYLHALVKERRDGAARARAKGFLPPPQCRVSAATTAS
jgi:hypothetical protein